MNFEILGLNKYQSRVLETLIKFGELTAYEISKYSGVPTNKVYQALHDLIRMGFVVEIPSETRRFRASDLNLIKKKIEEMKGELDKLSKDIDKYKYMYQLEDVPVRVSHGVEGFWNLLSLFSPKSFSYSIKYYLDYSPKLVKRVKDLISRGVIVKTLARVDKETEENYKKWIKINPNIKKFENKGIAMAITDDEVLISLIKRNTTVLIKDEAFADVMKRLFEFTYNSL